MEHNKTNNILYWAMDGTNTDPYFLPPHIPPHPHPQGAKQLNRKHIFTDVLFLLGKKWKKSPDKEAYRF